MRFSKSRSGLPNAFFVSSYFRSPVNCQPSHWQRGSQSDFISMKLFSKQNKITRQKSLPNDENNINFERSPKIMSFQTSDNDREDTDDFPICFQIYFEFCKTKSNFHKTRFSQSQAVHLFYIVQSSNDVNRYIPGYIRVSWWTAGLSQMKRKTQQFPKISFSVAR